MKELGEFLKKAREERLISLNDIGDRTKIQLHYLKALESGDFDLFPGEVYLKGALRNYAELVGLSPEEVLEKYHTLKGEALPEEPVPEPVKKHLAPPQKIGADRAPSFVYGLIVLVLLLAAGGYWLAAHYQQRGAAEPDPHGEQAGEADPDRSEEPAGEETGGDEKPPDLSSVEIKPLPEASTPQETVFSVGNVAKLELKLLCSDRCWIRVQLDGGEQFQERNLPQGEELLLDASEKIWIRLGNPPGVELTVNGAAVKETRNEKNAHNFLFVLK